ncbi:amino acid transporter [Pullulanibacillus pueri]|uniref:Aspartate:proton symporter n=1 Tax=Pullulanibacillus pueri TaxID=1437324 RepID=A0A8J2ZU71_9BACL|nr:APC family permease [Pullulanibacillus pueri]MBM7680747.1 amino acid transporter [Pullulanibacillus pueri]GGH78180.1 aspartate:proton symporter [Pullulanibacillus pueri]
MEQGQFKKKLTLLDLTFLGCGSIIGSGWLYGSMNAASLAGSLAWISWIIGAIIFMLIGLVYAELSAALPRSGGFLRYPDYSHGSMVGYLAGFASLLGYTSVIGVEVEAVRQYASAWLGGMQDANGNPTILGFLVQAALIVLFFLINYWSVNFFGKVNTALTFFKFVVPILIVIILLLNMHPSNFSAGGADPGGIHGVFKAVVAAGIAFAFLGFRQSVDFAAEAKKPQTSVPWSIILSVVLCLVLYIILQIAFIGAVPANVINGGWASIDWESPWVNLAKLLGAYWLATLVSIDAAISPAATGNIFLSGTARVMFAWAKNGYFYSIFQKVDKRTGLPRGALWLALIMGIAWTLPGQFQSWSGLVGAVTSAFVLTYMLGPISLASFRKTDPDLPRPFKLRGASVISPLAFVAASLVAYWSGWATMEILIVLMVASLILYLAFVDKDKRLRATLKEDFKATIWLFGYYAFMLIILFIGSFGPTNDDGEMPHQLIKGPWDSIILAVGALVIYYWGVASALKKSRIILEEDEVSDVQAS